MNKIPASKETIEGLYKNMGNNFLLYLPMICDYVSSIENLEKAGITEAKAENEVVKLKLRKTLLRLQVFALMVNLDLSTILRANFRSISNQEKRCNLKYVNVMTLEGYRYLFGCGNDAKNSIWGKFKLLSEQINDHELKSDICNFEQCATTFGSQYIDSHSRNLSIHYDQEPFKVYENLEKITEEDEANRTIAFLGVLESLSAFVKRYVQKYNISIVSPTNSYDLSLREAINVFPDRENKLFNASGDAITSFCERLDSIVSRCQNLELLKEKFNLDDSYLEKLQPLINTMSPGIHMHFIYLDLASSIRAYLSSEYYFEKQLNLRRINIVVYEGFKHIYGYTDNDHKISFWQKNIYSILEKSTDPNVTGLLTQIEVELKRIAANTDINNEQLRECSVHYRYKKRDNIIPLFHELVRFNPLVEMNKAQILIKILPKLIELNTGSLSVVYNTENEKIQLANKGTIEKIDNTIMLIENSTATSDQKHNFIDIANKIKGMLLS